MSKSGKTGNLANKPSQTPQQLGLNKLLDKLSGATKVEIMKLSPAYQKFYVENIHSRINRRADITKVLLPEIGMSQKDLNNVFTAFGIPTSLHLGTKGYILQAMNNQPMIDSPEGTDGKVGPITKSVFMPLLKARNLGLYQKLVKKQKTFESSSRGRRLLSENVSASESEIRNKFRKEKFIETSRNSHFSVGLGYFVTKDGKRYWHIVRRAAKDPKNGIREMKGRWDITIAREWAKDLSQRFNGIPPALILGFADLESGRGYNSLSRTLGNYFGIKPGGQKNYRRRASAELADHSQLPDFLNRRSVQAHNHYPDAWSSFYHYAYLVAKGYRYRSCRRVSSLASKAALIALGGYCPSGDYIYKVITRIRKYGSPGTISYEGLKAHLPTHKKTGKWKYIKNELQYWKRLKKAADKGYVTGFPPNPPA